MSREAHFKTELQPWHLGESVGADPGLLWFQLMGVDGQGLRKFHILGNNYSLDTCNGNWE